MSGSGTDGDAPRLKIVLTKEALYALLDRLDESPVTVGAEAELSRAAIAGDRFRLSYCLKCGDHGALYCFEGGLVSICSRCAIERIERLAGAGRVLPPSVLWLYGEAERELVAQARREREKLSVKFNDIYRCYRCNGLMREEDARYWGPNGGNVSYPFHAECREIYASGKEKYVAREQTEFDFDV